jgi:hypothetical protein
MKTQDFFFAIIHIRYYCVALNSELTLTSVSGNQAQGIFKLNQVCIPIIAYRHSENSKLRGVTNIWFAGSDINPIEFVGGTGQYDVPDAVTGLPARLMLAGAYPTEDLMQTFSGNYLRQD